MIHRYDIALVGARSGDAEPINIKHGFQKQTKTWASRNIIIIILIQPDGEKQLTSNPFMTAKVIQGIAGEVKAVMSLRNGDILVHCALRSHALNLLKLKAFAGIPCKVSPHRSLNSSKGIIRDRERCLQSMTEETITKELADQGVIHVKRFTVKTSAGVSNKNTYLMTFSCASLPQAIKAGYHNIKVEV